MRHDKEEGAEECAKGDASYAECESNGPAVGRENRIYRGVGAVLRAGRGAAGDVGAVRAVDRQGAGHRHGGVRRHQAGRVLLQGPVPAGVSVRPGLRDTAHRCGHHHPVPPRRSHELFVRDIRHSRAGGRPVQDPDRRGRQAIRHSPMVAGTGAGSAHRRHRTAAGAAAH